MFCSGTNNALNQVAVFPVDLAGLQLRQLFGELNINLIADFRA
jgi:hypothetical protein